MVWILPILIAVIWSLFNHGDALAMPSGIMHADGGTGLLRGDTLNPPHAKDFLG
jgi:hypothetical protein